jgi:hypothetical protein
MTFPTSTPFIYSETTSHTTSAVCCLGFENSRNGNKIWWNTSSRYGALVGKRWVPRKVR